jgi:hypothetical protein
MSVNTACQEYNENKPQWETVRDTVAGNAAVKKKGDAYLPRLGGQTDDDYKQYLERAVFFDGTSRTAEGLHGHVFAKDPVQTGELSDPFRELLKNVDASGTGIDQFAGDITWDAMQTCWGGMERLPPALD